MLAVIVEVSVMVSVVIVVVIVIVRVMMMTMLLSILAFGSHSFCGFASLSPFDLFVQSLTGICLSSL